MRVFTVLIRRKLWLYIYIYFNCYILATKSFLRGSDDRLCKIKMIGEIRQNFTEASASVGLILATALLSLMFAAFHNQSPLWFVEEKKTSIAKAND